MRPSDEYDEAKQLESLTRALEGRGGYVWPEHWVERVEAPGARQAKVGYRCRLCGFEEVANADAMGKRSAAKRRCRRSVTAHVWRMHREMITVPKQEPEAA